MQYTAKCGEAPAAQAEAGFVHSCSSIPLQEGADYEDELSDDLEQLSRSVLQIEDAP